MAKEVYINIMENAGGATFGVSNNLETSSENLKIIYGEDLAEIFRMETIKNGIFRQFDKYCQYIFSIETAVIPSFNIIMVFIDCHNNVDTALEFYSTEGSGLYKSEQTKFMELFNEIQGSSLGETASLKLINY